MSIVENLAHVLNNLQRIADTVGRHPPALLAVSKLKPADDVLAAYEAGQRRFGENYVQELVSKAQVLPADIEWVLIGHLQSNKCRALLEVPNLVRINTLDSVSLAQKLNHVCQDLNRSVDVLVQIKGTDEENKTGIALEDAWELVKYVAEECPRLNFRGLMTIGHTHDAEKTREAFRDVAELGHDLLWQCAEFKDTIPPNRYPTSMQELILSMGMSGDLAIAIEEGSTEVRLGSAIFGDRPQRP